MAQLLLHGTNFVNFVGLFSWSGLQDGFQATRVTEWDEPQAVIGTNLHRHAFPDCWRAHVERNHRERVEWTRGETFHRNPCREARPLQASATLRHATRGPG